MSTFFSTIKRNTNNPIYLYHIHDIALYVHTHYIINNYNTIFIILGVPLMFSWLQAFT